ncbi:MAG: hypothetical protein R6W82_04205 [bacterium]
MGLFDWLKGIFSSPTGSEGLGAMDRDQIRDLVQDSLDETEATSEVVERAQDARERARDLMRQGLYEEALERFRESREAWEAQAAICREKGFKNLWPGRPQQVGREMAELRIAFLDVLDLSSFRFLTERARLRREQVVGILRILGDSGDEGVSEEDIYDAFPHHQREGIRSVLLQAQKRGWVRRGGSAERYRLFLTDDAPDPEDAS